MKNRRVASAREQPARCVQLRLRERPGHFVQLSLRETPLCLRENLLDLPEQSWPRLL
jgi:hypothetical protein